MGVRNPNSTSYVHPDEPNLLNLHKAMEYDVDGIPHVRVSLGSDNITISGNVNVLDSVRINNTEAQMIPVYLVGNVLTVTQGTTPWYANANIIGNISGITSLPAISGNVSLTGNLAGVSTLPAVTGNVHVYGNVSIDQLPYIRGNVSVTQGTSPWIVQGNVTVNQDAGTPSLVKYINTPNNLQMDMTQRLRVSAVGQQWWYAPTVDKDGDLRYIEANVGANSGSIFVQNLSSINMTPGTDSNGSFTRISRRRHKMRPGSSMSAAFSVNWNGYVPDGNVTKRVGVFTAYNGVFYEMTGDLSVVIRRRLTDGTLVENRVARTDFSIDKLDGTGETGYDLRPVVLNTSTITAYVSTTAVPISGDGTVYRVVFTVGTPSQFYVGMKGRITGVSPSLFNGTVMVTAINGSNVTFVYNQDPGVFSSLSSAKFEHSAFHNQYVFGFDFNGNRATSVRFFIDGPLGRVAIHQENFGGSLSTPFSNAPAISARYEIFNTGAPSRLPNLTCSSEVINVEAEVEPNPAFGVAQRSTTLSITKGVRTEYALLGVGLRTGEPFQRSDLQVQGVQIIDAGNVNTQNAGVYQWRLVLNPTFGGTAVPTPTNVGKTSRMWNYNNGTTITGGITLTGGYVTSTSQIDVRSALNFINLGSNITYDDADKLVLAISLLVDGTSNAELLATMNFIEAL